MAYLSCAGKSHVGMPRNDPDADDPGRATCGASGRSPVMKMSFLARALLAATLALSAVPGFAAGPADLMASADDDALAEALVRRRLSQDDLAPYHRLEVVVRDGVATLTGSVRTKSTLDAVVTEVGKVAGVDRVDDRVKVEPNP
ncbi:MAG: hypothetical protein DI570_24700 [Phenylobacterium zucineum]|nr:MAG: hypothetical protein DI570_24700 [Phenylobacterium zucineum]